MRLIVILFKRNLATIQFQSRHEIATRMQSCSRTTNTDESIWKQLCDACVWRISSSWYCDCSVCVTVCASWSMECRMTYAWTEIIKYYLFMFVCWFKILHIIQFKSLFQMNRKLNINSTRINSMINECSRIFTLRPYSISWAMNAIVFD